MSKGTVNRVILIGNLGQDPEVKFLQSGTAVCNLRLATTEAWKDKASGEAQEHTEWHTVTLFGKTAEIAGQYLRKGAKVYVEGKLKTRKWQDKSGNDRYSTEITADQMQMLGGKSDSGEERPARTSQANSETPFDDDIPF